MKSPFLGAPSIWFANSIAGSLAWLNATPFQIKAASIKIKLNQIN
jgi:hypothetical protein